VRDHRSHRPARSAHRVAPQLSLCAFTLARRWEGCGEIDPSVPARSRRSARPVSRDGLRPDRRWRGIRGWPRPRTAPRLRGRSDPARRARSGPPAESRAAGIPRAGVRPRSTVGRVDNAMMTDSAVDPRDLVALEPFRALQETLRQASASTRTDHPDMRHNEHF
jgi:hypothetical protein